jgi:hypothetical protein
MRGLAWASDFSAQNSFLVFLHWQVCGYGEIKLPKLNSARACVCLFFFSLFVLFSSSFGHALSAIIS